MLKTTTILAVWVAGWGVALSGALPSDDWSQWRGPRRDGRLPEADWPRSLDTHHLTRQWRVELGPSYSGPLIVGERIFITDSRDQSYEAAVALDRATGRELWRTEWEGIVKVPFFAAANGNWIRSTPAYDDQRLYVAGMRDHLLCLSAAEGKILWEIDFVRDTQSPVPAFGFVSSPLVIGDAVYVQAGASLAKIDKISGRIVWRTLKDEGGMWGSAFSSPFLTRLAGRDQLLVQTREFLAGVDPDAGTVLWQQPIKAFRGMNILTPVVLGDAVFTSAYGGRSQLHRVARQGEHFAVEELWQARPEAYMSTPVVIDGQAYLHLRNQRFTCLNLTDGSTQWVSEEKFGKYWSLVGGRDLVLGLDQTGWLYLLRLNPDQFELLDRRRVSEAETWAHLAVNGQDVVIRDLGGLTAWRWTP